MSSGQKTRDSKPISPRDPSVNQLSGGSPPSPTPMTETPLSDGGIASPGGGGGSGAVEPLVVEVGSGGSASPAGGAGSGTAGRAAGGTTSAAGSAPAAKEGTASATTRQT